MSKEIENLKNGVLNGDSVITNNHIQQQQQQQTKLNNNSNVDSTTTKAIVGGRLQFYKDGKFILELARAREGEKTGWISVPRKTYWPPTISTNSSTTFSKHESSTSLSYSDDNSSIQSSPWQRDHCWKQSRPRHNISKEMAFFYNRPEQFCLTGDSTKIAKTMRRRPHNKCNSNVKFMKKKEKNGIDEASSESNDSDEKESSSQNDSKESIDTLDGNNKTTNDKNGNTHKLDNILKKLADRMASKLALNGNNMNGTHNNNNNGHHHSIPTSYSLASHIANSINSNSQPHQHVSPRKRILRELEKVSLEDTKRSRPKSIVTATIAMTNGNGSIASTPPISVANIHSSSNGSLKTEKATPPASRPISSYSITSLLAHNTSSSSNSSNNSNASVGCNNNNNNSISSNDSSSASHYHQQPKSPSLMQNKRKSPNTTPTPPTQSPSPEHHAFHKYRPITTTPTSSSPYSNSYHSPNYMRGSPSPHDRLRTTSSFSPSHSYAGTSSPHHNNNNYGGTGRERDSSLSPNVERNSSQRSTPTTTSTIRTVPKKTAALRQQFSSPTMESSSKMSKSSAAAVTTTTAQNVKNEKPMDVDALLRPSALIPPPSMSTAAAMTTHPAAAQLSHYPYMYSPLSYLPHAVSPYYHPSFYNPAMMAAAAAAAYRFPGAMSYPPMPSTLSSPPPITSASSSSSSPIIDRNANGHQRNVSISSSSSPSAVSSTTTAHHHPPYVHSSPWNPISLTNLHHPDGNLIPKVKNEQHSDVPLNLSKH
ncbi:hypothetical protein PVAND_001180 [Polypedilum vanderplanki]|uniref:Uncharacterized protein n=1 Tax=Polypedilum vanderplanki TaxID=319348 RepID=A0A9J6BMQ8_POLVA|nr:hypothetical protein PVAND_001180 [Polypedilum vanderplanki]